MVARDLGSRRVEEGERWVCTAELRIKYKEGQASGLKLLLKLLDFSSRKQWTFVHSCAHRLKTQYQQTPRGICAGGVSELRWPESGDTLIAEGTLLCKPWFEYHFPTGTTRCQDRAGHSWGESECYRWTGQPHKSRGHRADLCTSDRKNHMSSALVCGVTLKSLYCTLRNATKFMDGVISSLLVWKVPGEQGKKSRMIHVVGDWLVWTHWWLAEQMLECLSTFRNTYTHVHAGFSVSLF